ncbi:hypothetical protein GEMRC1_008246 [Eukaryota sp. GEM-RC1]
MPNLDSILSDLSSSSSKSSYELWHASRQGSDLIIHFETNPSFTVLKQTLAATVVGLMDHSCSSTSSFCPSALFITHIKPSDEELVSCLIMDLSSHRYTSFSDLSASDQNQVAVSSLDNLALPLSLSLNTIQSFFLFLTTPLSPENYRILESLVKCLPTSRVGRQTIILSTVPLIQSFYQHPFTFFPDLITLLPSRDHRFVLLPPHGGLSNTAAFCLSQTGSVFGLVVVSGNRVSSLKDVKEGLMHRGFPAEVGPDGFSEILSINCRLLLVSEHDIVSMDLLVDGHSMFDCAIIVGSVKSHVYEVVDKAVKKGGRVFCVVKDNEESSVISSLVSRNLAFSKSGPMDNIRLEMKLLYPDVYSFIHLFSAASKLNVDVLSSRLHALLIWRQKNVDLDGFDVETLQQLSTLLEEYVVSLPSRDLGHEIECSPQCTCHLPPVECWVLPINSD